MKTIARWLESVARWMVERFDRCELCKEQPADAECPCGKRVCGDCQDYGIYSDEVCCINCALEIKQAWLDCPEHIFEEPYENDDGDTVEQCKRCCYARIVADSIGEKP